MEVFVNDDELYEDQEFFTTSLSVIGQVRHAVHISQRTATVFIENDDGKYCIVDGSSSNYTSVCHINKHTVLQLFMNVYVFFRLQKYM